MKKIQFVNWGHLFVLALLFNVNWCFALPRAPLPPISESAPLYYESFDEPYFAGDTDTNIFISGVGNLDQSWSGYALTRTGDSVTPS